MTVNDFIQLVADYHQAGDEFWREQYLTEGDKKSQLRINETFNKWSKLEKEVDEWLPRFQKGVCCSCCKHRVECDDFMYMSADCFEPIED